MVLLRSTALRVGRAVSRWAETTRMALGSSCSTLARHNCSNCLASTLLSIDIIGDPCDTKKVSVCDLERERYREREREREVAKRNGPNGEDEITNAKTVMLTSTTSPELHINPIIVIQNWMMESGTGYWQEDDGIWRYRYWMTYQMTVVNP